MKKSLAEQIEFTKAQYLDAKPTSIIKIRLYYRLRDLMIKQLKREIRQDKAAA